ncbi:MAG: RagB/SusD family nutrient uptake outer membrane protein [Bacteroidales bacterium]|jgi:hypothetical protein|nr:RagB/SusD family nutrient uptake outer membrane protein [Bacteroidales bacterium]
MKHLRLTALLCAIAILFTSCLKDLDKFPMNDKTKVDVYKDVEGYKMALAKVYGAMALSGNSGPAGSADIAGLDEGKNADFLRNFFNHQELPTDEAHCIWADEGITEMNNLDFIPTNPFTIGLYSKSLLQIMYANDFMRNCTDAELAAKNFTNAEKEEIAYFTAEARYIRAFQYWVLMDVFGNPPFVTENDNLGIMPDQISRSELFDYIESELVALGDEGKLKAPKANEYGRVDQAAAWALLARMYLNANVYKSPVGNPGNDVQYYTKAITYANKVINSGYSLRPGKYEGLFLNDNDKNNPEVIYSINYDGLHTKSYGGMSFLINCSSNGEYQTTYHTTLLHYGMFDNPNWAGYRFRGNFIDKFETGDKRALFVGEEKWMGDNPTDYTYGYAGYKYRNIPSTLTLAECDTVLAHDGKFGNDPIGGSADNDYPLFRLAEMYLIYAEAVKRGGSGGDEATAIGYLNLLRNRAELLPVSSYDLDYILDERGRELYWECQRRTDLVRYNRFTTDAYLWEWKGGVKEGKALDVHYNIFPLPSTDVSANTNLDQNPGY